MIYSLDILILSNNQTLLDAIKDKVPDKLDDIIWSDDYSIDDVENGVSIMVRFNEEAERQTVLNWMKTKAQQVKDDILLGSYVAYHLCDHDLGDGQVGCTPPTTLWSK